MDHEKRSGDTPSHCAFHDVHLPKLLVKQPGIDLPANLAAKAASPSGMRLFRVWTPPLWRPGGGRKPAGSAPQGSR